MNEKLNEAPDNKEDELQMTEGDVDELEDEYEAVKMDTSFMGLPFCLVVMMPKLSSAAVCAALYLYYFSDYLDIEEVLMPTDAELGSATGLSTSNAKRARKELTEKGILHIHGDRTFDLMYYGVSLADDSLKEEDFMGLPICLVTMMPELSPAAVCAALYLYYFSDYLEEILMPADTELGSGSGLSTSNAKRAQKELIEKGVLYVYEDQGFDLMYDEPFPPDEDDDEDDMDWGDPTPITMEQICADMNMSPEEAEASLKSLIDAGLVKQLPDGTVTLQDDY